jgi:hypothetical protein
MPDDPGPEEIDFSRDRHALKNAIFNLLQQEGATQSVQVQACGAALDARDGRLLEHTIANQELGLYYTFQHPDSIYSERIDVTIGDFNWKPVITITAHATPIQTIEITAKSAVVFQQLRSAIQQCLSNARTLTSNHNRPLPMPNQPQQPNTGSRLNIKLPDGSVSFVDTLDIPLSALMDTARNTLQDDKITPENFGVDKHFFFVNRSTGSLIDDHVPESFTLRTLQFQFGQEIELCLTKNAS